MTTYLVQHTGKNFLIDDGKKQTFRNFRSSRLVEAENIDRAEEIALEKLSAHLSAKISIINEESDPPVVLVEKVNEVSAVAYDAQNRAFSIYWEPED